jgi:hypothetical protein
VSSKSRDTASDLAIGSERDRVKDRVTDRVTDRVRGSARAGGSERVTSKSRVDNQAHATSNTGLIRNSTHEQFQTRASIRQLD